MYVKVRKLKPCAKEKMFKFEIMHKSRGKRQK